MKSAKETVLAFWEAMGSNDFFQASEWLAEDFSCFWPQSSECIIGRKNFAELNTHYPTEGRWTFEVHSIVCEGQQVVTDVGVSDGKVQARAITFHTVKKGLIQSQTEFWPDTFEAPEWRRKWVTLKE